MQQAPLVREERVPLDSLVPSAAARRLFAVLDACDAPWVPMFAEGMGEDEAVSLYRGEPQQSLSAVAPYLVAVDADALVWIRDAAIGRDAGWGVFVLADSPLAELRRHFRRFLRVLGPAGEPLYFRFYDPRVLPRYLDTCTYDEVAAFFGPVVGFGIAAAPAAGVRLLTRTPRIIIRRE